MKPSDAERAIAPKNILFVTDFSPAARNKYGFRETKHSLQNPGWSPETE